MTKEERGILQDMASEFSTQTKLLVRLDERVHAQTEALATLSTKMDAVVADTAKNTAFRRGVEKVLKTLGIDVFCAEKFTD